VSGYGTVKMEAIASASLKVIAAIESLRTMVLNDDRKSNFAFTDVITRRRASVSPTSSKSLPCKKLSLGFNQEAILNLGRELFQLYQQSKCDMFTIDTWELIAKTLRARTDKFRVQCVTLLFNYYLV
jgi:hypothetical protein